MSQANMLDAPTHSRNWRDLNFKEITDNKIIHLQIKYINDLID